MRIALYTTGVLAVLGSTAVTLSAGTAPIVPEISPATVSSGLGLLTGAALILRARLRGRASKKTK